MALLRRSAPYTSWTEESVADVCAHGQVVAYRKGDILNANHGQLAFVHFLEVGVFQSRVTIANGRDHTTGYMHPGALLGLAHAFALAPFPQVHEFVADTDATVWQVPADKFRELMWQHRPIGETVVAILATRADKLLDHLSNSVLLSAEARVARCLLQSSQEPNFHALFINFTLTAHNLSQAQLARILGLSRQSVGSILRGFERLGFIAMSRQRIEVVSADDLRRVVGGNGKSDYGHAGN
jgi:CRP/FNR family transcriptional regulator